LLHDVVLGVRLFLRIFLAVGRSRGAVLAESLVRLILIRLALCIRYDWGRIVKLRELGGQVDTRRGCRGRESGNSRRQVRERR